MADGSAMRGKGRPSSYSQEVGDAICELLMQGHTLRAVCRHDGMPPEVTVRGWAADPQHPFSAQYTRSREIGYQSMADELLDISDDGSNDWMEREGKEVENGEVLARSRLRVDTRKWLLSKALPKMYGDRIENRIAGPDGEALPATDALGTDARAVAFRLGRAVGRAEKAKAEQTDSNESR